MDFFLGSNSARGFYSLFSELSPYALSAIKGAPGSGKSTLMRAMAKNKEYSELIFCSADPGSLDGVIFSDGTAVVDGTAPHITEPRGGEYITMPRYKSTPPDTSALQSAISAAYADANTALRAWGEVSALSRRIALQHFDSKAFERRADAFLRKGKTLATEGRVTFRFADGITPRGLCALPIEPPAVGVSDPYGVCDGFFRRLAFGFAAKGAYVRVCLSPLEPNLFRHVVLPDAAFVTLDEFGKARPCARAIHTEPYFSDDLPRGRLRLLRKLGKALRDEALASLSSAGALHDELESVCRPYLDMDALSALQP